MTHTCPIEGNLINEPTVRVVALLISISAAIGIFYQSPMVFLFLAYDFFVRAYNRKHLSLFRYIGMRTINFLQIREKLIDSGGKKFAAKIGFILTAILTIASLFHLTPIIYSLGGILVLLAFLESALAICVGCKLYSLYNSLVSEKPY